YGGYEPITPQLYDIAAVQYLYGARTTSHSGNDTYTFSTSTQVKTIWDGGGTDVFDASNENQGVTVDLHAGAFSSIAGTNNIAIAYGTTIEGAVGSSYNDTLRANDAGDTLSGGAGNDRLTGGTGTDSLTGGSGSDTFVLTANFGADTITDFVPGVAGNDMIDLTAVTGIYNFAALLAIATQSGADTVINFGGRNVPTLKKGIKNNLDPSAFIFIPPPTLSPTNPSLPYPSTAPPP